MKRILLLSAFLVAGCEAPASSQLEKLNAEINSLRNKINELATSARKSGNVCLNYKVLTEVMGATAPKLESRAKLMEQMGNPALAGQSRERADKLRSGIADIQRVCASEDKKE